MVRDIINTSIITSNTVQCVIVNGKVSGGIVDAGNSTSHAHM